jgi:hypothetical protein
LARSFRGFVAHGPAKHWDEQDQLMHTYTFSNGVLVREVSR